MRPRRGPYRSHFTFASRRQGRILTRALPKKTPPRCDLRSPCPIAATLDVVGDRWTLLVLRDALFFGKSLFQEFLEAPEGISSNTLAERLKRLERWGILVREVYQRRPLRAR